MANEKRFIYVKDVLSKIDKEMELCNSGSIRGELKFLKGCVATLPTVDAVEVVHGRWVHKGAWHIECSECQYILAHIGEAKNYCPNCGAKMDGDGNEID